MWGPKLPAVSSWLALLLAGVSVPIFTNRGDLVAWLIQRRLVPESAADTATDAIAMLSSTVGILALIGAWGVFAWGLRIMSWALHRWPPADALLLYLERSVAPALSLLGRGALEASRHTARVVAAFGTALALGLRHIWQRTVFGVLVLARACGLGLRFLWLGMSAVARPPAVALRYLWHGVGAVFLVLAAAVGLALRFSWQGASAVGVTLVRALGIVLRHLGQGLTVVARLLGLGLFSLWLSLATGALAVATALGPVVRYLWEAVTTGLLASAVLLDSALGSVWRGTVAACFLAVDVLLLGLGALGRGFAAASRPIGVALRFVWLGTVALFVAAFGVFALGLLHLRHGATSILLLLAKSTGLVLLLTWSAVHAISFKVWLALRFISLSLVFTGRILGGATVTLLWYLWSGISTVAQTCARAVALVLQAVGLAAAILFLVLSGATGSIAHVVWRGTYASLHAVAFVLRLVFLALWQPTAAALFFAVGSFGAVLRFTWVGMLVSSTAVSAAARSSWPRVVLFCLLLARALGIPLRAAWRGVSFLALVFAEAVGIAVRYSWRGIATVSSTLGRALGAALRFIWLGAATFSLLFAVVLGAWFRSLRLAFSAVSLALAALLATGLLHVWRGITAITRPLGRTLWYLWRAVASVSVLAAGILAAVLRSLWRASRAATLALAMVLGAGLRAGWHLLSGVAIVLAGVMGSAFRLLWWCVKTVARPAGLGLWYAWLALSTVGLVLPLATGWLLHYVWLGITTLFLVVTAVLRSGLQYLWFGASTSFMVLVQSVLFVLRYLWRSLCTVPVVLTSVLGWALLMTWTGLTVLPDLARLVRWIVRHPGEVPAMSEFRLTRDRLLAFIGTLWLAGIAVVFAVEARDEPVVVTHWANGHMMSKALLPAFAEQFNAAGHRTQSGQRIEVRPFLVNSGVIKDQLIHRINPGAPLTDCEAVGCVDGKELPDPTVVTPVADHWLGTVNYKAGHTVVDLGTTKNLVTTWIGIVTLREMAQCLGWPNREIGFADIVALRNDPKGWESCPTAKAEWGRQPLVSFTDPSSSSTGRTMLITLYSMAAGKRPEDLTLADVTNPTVVEYVQQFQRGVDHYVPDTLTLNTKVYLGPRYGHFFFIAEDNLVKLYQGKETVNLVSGKARKPLDRDMVMIYPKEGSMAHRHSAAIVQAGWVSPEQAEAAGRWIAFLHEDAQQAVFMQEGFRPATGIALGDPISRRFGLDPSKPNAVLNPSGADPAVAEAIAGSWGEVKNSSVVTFVVDTSGSMSGTKLELAKQGVTRALDKMHARNLVGLLGFSDSVHVRVPVAPIAQNRYPVVEAVEKIRAAGNTALYDAVREGILMVDSAPGPADTIRGVVVLTDGKANRGQPLHDLIRMMSKDEKPIPLCPGFDGEDQCLDDHTKGIAKPDIIGTGLAVTTRHRIHVFFVGIGDADLEIGRMLAEATGAAYKGTTEKDLATVLEEFGKYF